MSQITDTTSLFGLSVLKGTHAEILDCLIQRFSAGEQTHVLTLNPEIVMDMHADADTADLMRRADVVVADGVGIEKAARLLGAGGIQRYPGVDLARDLLGRLPGARTFLLGSRPGVAEAAAASLRMSLPQANIAGFRDGYFEMSDARAVAGEVESLGTDILLVGMGSPRQERFIVEARQVCSAKLMVGVGGSLEVYAGVKQRAPQWVQTSGLEWLHRLTQDSARLGRLASLPRFVNLVMRDYVGMLNDQVC